MKAVTKNNSTAGHYEYEPITVKIFNCDRKTSRGALGCVFEGAGGAGGFLSSNVKRGNSNRRESS